MKKIGKFNKVLFITSFIALIFFTFYKLPLPNTSEIITPIKEIEPTFTQIEKDPYKTNIDGTDYMITPYYSFIVSGLVVEQYDSENWLDRMHKNDPAQTKDLCLVWGENIKSEVYKHAKYKHGEFTCFFQLDRKWMGKFSGQHFTNTHLVPKNESLKKLISKAKVGDQVYIKGELIDYSILDDQGIEVSHRKTSTTMNDHDCEVILVEDFKIIKRQNYFVREARSLSGIIFSFSTLTGVLLFLKGPVK